MSDNARVRRSPLLSAQSFGTLARINRSTLMYIFLLGVATLAVMVLLVRTGPPLWWDEGWTLSVARNWVERGHYGRLLNGQLAPNGLEAALPTVASVALSFRLLGVGIWQARLPGLLYTCGALFTLAYLAKQLYGRPVAVATLICAVLLPGHPALSALYTGKQILAEMPMLFFLLVGYVGFLWVLQRSLWYLPLAILAWAIALNTKAQVTPFWITSLLVAASIALVWRNWRYVSCLVVSLGGTLIVSRQLVALQGWFLRDMLLPAQGVVGLYDVTALVLVPDVRALALNVTLLFGLPTLGGLLYSVPFGGSYPGQTGSHPALRLIHSMLLVLTASWLAWFLLLSVGWTRYLMPPLFLGSVFVALLIHGVTDQFNAQSTVARLFTDFRRFRLGGHTALTILVFLLLASVLPFTITTLKLTFSANPDANAAEATANYLHAHADQDALIETYDSELHFLLQRPYHYPPDQLHVELNRRTFLGQDVKINYDPLAANPDYLVVGPYSRMWKLYEPVLATDVFQHVASYGQYDIYARTNASQ